MELKDKNTKNMGTFLHTAVNNSFLQHIEDESLYEMSDEDFRILHDILKDCEEFVYE